MKIYYRLSDKGKKTGKPDYINIQNCLRNFTKHFPVNSITIIADNCNEETLQYLNDFRVIKTKLGNSKSLLFTLNLAIHDNDDNEIIYFVEDDYIHRSGSYKALQEGLEISDYVSLYDHPDKYNNKHGNPYVCNVNEKYGGEISQVFCGDICHWKTTNSTTMTFACKIKTLKEDFFIFEHWLENNYNEIPNDFVIFQNLINKKRLLITPMPSFSTHGETEFLAKLIDWQSIIS